MNYDDWERSSGAQFAKLAQVGFPRSSLESKMRISGVSKEFIAQFIQTHFPNLPESQTVAGYDKYMEMRSGSTKSPPNAPDTSVGPLSPTTSSSPSLTSPSNTKIDSSHSQQVEKKRPEPIIPGALTTQAMENTDLLCAVLGRDWSCGQRFEGGEVVKRVRNEKRRQDYPTQASELRQYLQFLTQDYLPNIASEPPGSLLAHIPGTVLQTQAERVVTILAESYERSLGHLALCSDAPTLMQSPELRERVIKLQQRILGLQESKQGFAYPCWFRGSTSSLVWLSFRSEGPALVKHEEMSSEATLSLTVCNAGGPGIQYHPSKVDGPGVKFSACFTIRGISFHRAASIPFLLALLRLELTRSDNNTAKVLYEVLLPFLTAKSLVESCEVEQPVVWVRRRVNSACTHYASTNAFLKYLLSSSFDADQIFRFMLILRTSQVPERLLHQHQHRGLAAAFSRLCLKGINSQVSIHDLPIKNILEEPNEPLPKLQAAMDSQGENFTSKPFWCQTRAIKHVVNQRPFDVDSGSIDLAEMHPSLFQFHARGKGYRANVALVQECAHVCQKLWQHAKIFAPNDPQIIFITTLIEWVFIDCLSLDGTRWTIPVGQTPELVLQNLYDITLTYIAAISSVDMDVNLDSAALVVTASIVTIFDQLVRQTSRLGPRLAEAPSVKLSHFDGTSFGDLTSKLSLPRYLADRRSALLTYWEPPGANEDLVHLFGFEKVGVSWMSPDNVKQDPSFCLAAKLNGDFCEKKEGDTGLGQKNGAKLLCEAWEYLPEFAQYRDMILLYRWVALSRSGAGEVRAFQADPATQVWSPQQIKPDWLCALSRDEKECMIMARVSGQAVRADARTRAVKIPSAASLHYYNTHQVSPIAVNSAAHEAQLLYSSKLGGFGVDVSQEEHEYLLSLLTAPYVRIPLVLGYLAEHRANLLFNTNVQAMLWAVLFEGGAVPSGQQKNEETETLVPATPETNSFTASDPPALRSKQSFLSLELCQCATVLTPIFRKLFSALIGLCRVCPPSSPAAFALLYLLRLATQLREYTLALAVDASPDISRLQELLDHFLLECQPRLAEWSDRLQQPSSTSLTHEALLELRCVYYAHEAITACAKSAWGESDQASCQDVVYVVSRICFVRMWATRSTLRNGKEHVDETSKDQDDEKKESGLTGTHLPIRELCRIALQIKEQLLEWVVATDSRTLSQALDAIATFACDGHVSLEVYGPHSWDTVDGTDVCVFWHQQSNIVVDLQQCTCDISGQRLLALPSQIAAHTTLASLSEFPVHKKTSASVPVFARSCGRNMYEIKAPCGSDPTRVLRICAQPAQQCFMFRVEYEATDVFAAVRILNTLRELVEIQLTAPHPGVVFYHFTRPDVLNRPTVIELTELYQDEKVFWEHGMSQRFQELYRTHFIPDNCRTKTWRVYGNLSPVVKRMCDSFDCVYPSHKGFLLNPRVGKIERRPIMAIIRARVKRECDSPDDVVLSDCGDEFQPSVSGVNTLLSEISATVDHISDINIITFMASCPASASAVCDMTKPVLEIVTTVCDLADLQTLLHHENYSPLRVIADWVQNGGAEQVVVEIEVYGTENQIIELNLPKTLVRRLHCIIRTVDSDAGYVCHPGWDGAPSEVNDTTLSDVCVARVPDAAAGSSYQPYLPPSCPLFEQLPSALIDQYDCFLVEQSQQTLLIHGYSKQNDGSKLVLTVTETGEISVTREINYAKLFLMNLLDVKRSLFLHKIAQLFARVESLQHILLWSDVHSMEPTILELPRLSKSFALSKKEGDLKLSIHSVECGGYQLRQDLVQGALLDLLHALPEHSLLLESSTKALVILLPNYGFPNKSSRGSVWDKSEKWSNSVSTPYYLFPVHPLESFVQPPDLASSIYLALTFLLTNHYHRAFQALDHAITDCAFNGEESWVFSQIIYTLHDMTPNAAACRLKAFYQCCYFSQEIPPPGWSVQTDMEIYIDQFHCVSANCHLELEMEASLIEYLLLSEKPQQASDVRCAATIPQTTLIPLSTLLLTNRRAHLDVQLGKVSTTSAQTPPVAHGGGGWRRIEQSLQEFVAEFATGTKGPLGIGLPCERLGLISWEQMEEAQAKATEGGLPAVFCILYQALSSTAKLDLETWGKGSEDAARLWAQLIARMVYIKSQSIQQSAMWPRDLFSALVGVSLVEPAAIPALPFPASNQQKILRKSYDLQLWSRMMLKAIESHTKTPHWPGFAAPFRVSISVPCTHGSGFPTGATAWKQTPTLATRFELGTMENSSLDISDQELHLLCTAPMRQFLPRATESQAPKRRQMLLDDLCSLTTKDFGEDNAEMLSSLQQAAESISEHIHTLEQSLEEHITNIQRTLSLLLKEANTSSEEVGSGADVKAKLQAVSGRRTIIGTEHLCRALQYSRPDQFLQSLNPGLQNNHSALSHDALITLLLGTRRKQIQDCLPLAFELQNACTDLIGTLEFSSKPCRESLHIQCVTVASVATSLRTFLSAERVYASQRKREDGWIINPSYVVFESLSGFMLRPRQAELVASFMSSVRLGSSCVQQMLMGGGKTTVVCPLLVLLLGDGERNVTQIVPDELVDMSCAVLRKTLSSPVFSRPIFRFNFGRYALSQKLLSSGWRKFQCAAQRGGVVVTTPGAVKSLYLKFLELALPGAPSQNSEVQACADLITRILQHISTAHRGVALLDEVDLILHPLKSELNFPIGPKEVLDLLPERYQLPLHLLTLFSDSSPTTSSDVQVETHINLQLREALTRGIELTVLQQTPHIIVLDVRYYHTTLKPILTSITLSWLRANPRFNDSTEPLNLSGYAVNSTTTKSNLHAAANALSMGSNQFWCSADNPGACSYQIDFPVAQKLAALKIDFVLLSNFLGFSGLSMVPDEVIVHASCVSASPEGLEVVQWNKIAVLVGEEVHHGVLFTDTFNVQSLRLEMQGIARWFAIKSISVDILGSCESPSTISDEAFFSFLNADQSALDITTLPFRARQLTNLARDVLNSYLPHMLCRVNRVHYGILPNEVAQAGHSLSRSLLAIPFRGKDCPTAQAEFSHPDILISATILAYGYQGLRLMDVTALLNFLQTKMKSETGPPALRPSALRWESWLASVNTSTIAPLQLVQVEDVHQIRDFQQSLGKSPTVIAFYLEQVVFPQCLQYRVQKLAASGQELGGSAIFPTRLGFSGTPNNLLPLDLGECQFEQGTEETMSRTLEDFSVVNVLHVTEWDINGLLQLVAREASPQFCALIDCGALITNKNNQEVAAYLLRVGLDWAKGVVYFGEGDKAMVWLRNGHCVSLQQCSLLPHERFTYYDHIHTTGMDVKQPICGVAAVTIGKDSTFRDVAQACWRMRGLGKGQTVTLILIREIKRLVMEASLQVDINAHCSLHRIVSWLRSQGAKLHNNQLPQLLVQQLHNVWREGRFKALLRHRQPTTSFLESIEYKISASEKSTRSFAEFLLELAKTQSADTLKSNEKRDVNGIISNAGSKEICFPEVHEERLDCEVVLEEDAQQQVQLGAEVTNEREQEKEQQQHDIPDPQPRRAWSGKHEPDRVWRFDQLQEDTSNYLASCACPFQSFSLPSLRHQLILQPDLVDKVWLSWNLMLLPTGQSQQQQRSRVSNLFAVLEIINKETSRYVGVSLSEAQTIRRAIHSRTANPSVHLVLLTLTGEILASTAQVDLTSCWRERALTLFRFWANEPPLTNQKAMLGDCIDVLGSNPKGYYYTLLQGRRRVGTEYEW